MSKVQKNKSDLRSFYLRKREQIPTDQKDIWDQSIFNRFIQLNSYINAEVIHVYVSIDKKNEVDTFQTINHSLRKGKKVVVPKIANDGLLEHFEINTTADLKRNNWGILEPEGGREVNTQELDIIIVPMVAGDRGRNRLGYGKGFYDRFLSTTDAFKVGLLFDIQIYPDLLPVESFDVQLDLLLTQTELI